MKTGTWHQQCFVSSCSPRKATASNGRNELWDGQFLIAKKHFKKPQNWKCQWTIKGLCQFLCSRRFFVNEGVDQSYTSEIFSFNASIIKSIRQLAVFPFLEIQKTINSMLLGFCQTKELTKCVKHTSLAPSRISKWIFGHCFICLFVCFSFNFR